ncbi:MAG: cation-efflux pump, partial [Candidatus Eisenbacteria bacterium]|nr:cation-efflux pump [Candidatus Eisenbacteria bacterium]
LRRSARGLMDGSLPEEEVAAYTEALDSFAPDGIIYHALRTRRASSRRFVSVHVLVPGDWTVQKGHDAVELVEAKIRSVLPRTTVFTHLEPIEDPASWDDVHLDRH